MGTRSYKVVLLGSSGVGKTSLAHRIKFKTFPADTASTIGCEFFAKTHAFPDGSTIKFLIWDTSGQEVFRTFTPQFSRGAYLALVFYDTGSTLRENDLIQTLKEWIAFTPESCTILVVPTKHDTLGEANPRKLDGKLFLDTLRDVRFAEPTSAKQDTGIDELMSQMASILLPMESRMRWSPTVEVATPEKKESCCST
jgi:small GTP-binding protein